MFSTTDEIRIKIKQFLSDNFFFGIENSLFSDDSSFIETGIIDSTGVLELINFIQPAFNININDDEMLPSNLDSINNLVAFVKKKSLE